MQLNEIMSKADTWFSPADSLVHITQVLSEKHHSCALICQEKVPIGIVTERDVVRLFGRVSNGEIATDVPVGDVMTLNPISLSADLTIDAALEVAQESHLRHLPIVDADGNLEGIVTLTDIVKAHLATLEANERLNTENEKLQIQSLQDALTLLPNRRAMEIELRHSEAVVRRNSSSYCVAIMDLDYFKGYNDHYGHLAGDGALRNVADLIKDNLRATDKAFRYGGEEFLILMQDTDCLGAQRAAERIRLALADSCFPHAKSVFGMLTISIGIAQSSTDTNIDWEQIVARADLALYKAKEDGRNQVQIDNESFVAQSSVVAVVPVREALAREQQ